MSCNLDKHKNLLAICIWGAGTTTILFKRMALLQEAPFCGGIIEFKLGIIVSIPFALVALLFRLVFWDDKVAIFNRIYRVYGIIGAFIVSCWVFLKWFGVGSFQPVVALFFSSVSVPLGYLSGYCIGKLVDLLRDNVLPSM